MIYTIGYQKLAPATLQAIVGGLNAILIDVRSSPNSRIAGFGKRTLQETYGESYQWRGDVLGGRLPGVKGEGVAFLEEMNRKRRPLILMCMEELPHNCHRHHHIALPHFQKAKHIFNGGWCYRVADVQAQYESYPEALDIDPLADKALYEITCPE